MREPKIVLNGFVCCVLTYATAHLLAGVSVLWLRTQHGTLAKCQDGRLASTAKNVNSTVAIHVPPGDVIDIACLIPVVVYDVRLPNEPRQNLRQVGTQTVQRPFEQKTSGVKCMHANASIFAHFNNIIGLQFYKDCEHDRWDCNRGDCSSYHKALRMCLSKLAPEPYECNYVPGKPMWGVTRTSSQITQGVQIFFSLVVMMFLSVAFVVHDDSESGYGYKFGCENAIWAIAMLMFGTLFTYLECRAMTQQTLRFSETAYLSSHCTTGPFHMCGFPSPEEAPWNHTMSPRAYYFMYGIISFVLCMILALSCLAAFFGLFTPQARRETRSADERTPLV